MARDAYEEFLKSLERRRAPAMEAAGALLAQDRYDEAERAVTSVDDSIYGAVAVGRMYTERLRRLVEAGEGRGERAKETFRRALRWRQSAYPEAHTEVEAEQYERGCAEDLAELVKILGYDASRA